MTKQLREERNTRTRRYQYLIPISLVLILLSVSLMNTARTTRSVQARAVVPQENNGLATTPLMGWSSWSTIRYYPSEAAIKAQAQAMASKLKSYGYSYINQDDYWYLNPSTTVDQYGRWAVDTSRFPDGISGTATYVHNLGLKFGLYLTPGIPVAAYNQNTPIEGTNYHARDIVTDTSTYETNYGNSTAMYYIDYSRPGAQAFINSWANELASWGVDFLKIDGVGTWDIPDVQAWSTALKQSGRSIYFSLSNNLDVNSISTWQQNANGWRIDGDVECYCSSLVTWNSFSSRFGDVVPFINDAGPGGWNDLDSLDVGNGSLDGLTNDERQTYMSLWAIEAAPLSVGDDLTTLDSYGLSLLTNTEVIAVDQAGHPAHPISQASNQQVWFSKNGDGSYTVALFNLGTSTATITANWKDLGFSGVATVRDLWSHTDLGTATNSFSASLNGHASRLLRVVPGTVTPTPTPMHTPTVTPTPIPTSGSYEAESSVNTLAGGAMVAACSACSGGQDVGYIGRGGTLQFKKVRASSSGTYALTIYYVDGDAGRSAQMSVNGGASTTISFPGTNDSNWDFVQSLTVSVQLKKSSSSNTILFSNASAYAPDIDRITITA